MFYKIYARAFNFKLVYLKGQVQSDYLKTHPNDFETPVQDEGEVLKITCITNITLYYNSFKSAYFNNALLIVGLTLSIPSANTVNCTVACRLSRPDCPLCAQTSLTPLRSYVLLSSNTNGKGVWSMFAISLS